MGPGVSNFSIINLELFEVKRRGSLRKLANKVVQSAFLPKAFSLELAFVSAAEMTELCERFLGKSKTTDVLSFPASDEFDFPGMPKILGEIALCAEVAQAQAEELGHSLEEEVAVLLAHGLLHLLGLDHEQGLEQARQQAEMEMAILDLAGIAPHLALAGRSL